MNFRENLAVSPANYICRRLSEHTWRYNKMVVLVAFVGSATVAAMAAMVKFRRMIDWDGIKKDLVSLRGILLQCLLRDYTHTLFSFF